MMVVALTGGIGCGKSTVSRHFEDLGIPVLDTDILARKLVQPGTPALEEIRLAFGEHLINDEGHLKRSALRKIVFDEPDKKKLLEKIIHPRIRKAMEAWIPNQSGPYVILVIPLLFETNLSDFADRILVIDCDEETQVTRVKRRDGMTSTEAKKIIRSQISREYRQEHADDIILNTGSKEALIQDIKSIHIHYMALSKRTTQ
jgi:dephospho-CoA kinase